MIKGYWVTLTNIGCELDKQFAKTLIEVQKIIVGYVKTIEAGDTITIEEGESEA